MVTHTDTLSGPVNLTFLSLMSSAQVGPKMCVKQKCVLTLTDGWGVRCRAVCLQAYRSPCFPHTSSSCPFLSQANEWGNLNCVCSGSLLPTLKDKAPDGELEKVCGGTGSLFRLWLRARAQEKELWGHNVNIFLQTIKKDIAPERTGTLTLQTYQWAGEVLWQHRLSRTRIPRRNHTQLPTVASTKHNLTLTK